MLSDKEIEKSSMMFIMVTNFEGDYWRWCESLGKKATFPYHLIDPLVFATEELVYGSKQRRIGAPTLFITRYEDGSTECLMGISKNFSPNENKVTFEVNGLQKTTLPEALKITPLAGIF